MSESLGHLASTVSLNIDPFKSSATALKAQIKSTAAALKAQEAAIKGAGNSVNGMKSAYGSMQQQMKNYNAQLERQKATYDKLKSTTAETEAEQQKLTARQANAANQYNRTSANIEALRARMATMKQQIVLQEDGWTRAGDKMVAFGSKTTQVSQKLSAFGSGMTTKVTAPIMLGLAAAAKSAIDFNSQISAIGPLLTNGGKITASVRQELDQMSSSSKKWSMQFGVSTGKINDGMTEMVKRGYSAKQTMGAMPAVLNAAKASGDDFNDVMHVSTSVLEQFGLKTNSTNGMLKNTGRVTDSLTYVANATAAGFQDMGEAMTYVGPSAHAAGISLEETAAAIGIMSNKGIEGSVAGTALRGALTRLLKPSKQNVAGFKELGVNVEDFKNGTLTLPQIIDKIKTNTKGWTDEQRASAVAMAFGTEAQAGMNALISAGGDELRKYTKGAKESAGTTNEIADQLNNTQAAKVARFKESIHVLGIEVGEKLLPALTPLIQKATEMVQSFSEMDDSTQQSIIKWALFAATIGPVAGGLGKVGSLIGGTSTVIGSLAQGVGRMNTAAKLGGTGLDILKSGFSKSAFEATTFAGAAGTAGTAAEGMAGGMTAAGAGSTGLLATLGPVGAAIGATALVVGAGVAVWELWGKKAYESGQRTKRWGTDIGAAADDSLNKMNEFSGNATIALDTWSGKSKESASDVSQAFKQMYDKISSDAEASNKKIDKQLSSLPVSVSNAIKKSAESQKKQNTESVAQAKQTSDNVNDIVQRAAKEHRQLTDDEKTYIVNSQRDMGEKEVSVLRLSSQQKKTVMAALNDDVDNMTKKQRQQGIYDLEMSARKEAVVYNKQKKTIKDMYNSGEISAQAYRKGLNELADDHQKKTDTMAEAVYKLGKANHESKDEINQDLLLVGSSYEKVSAKIKKENESASKASGLMVRETDNMSKSAAKAADHWNSLVLDPKTGEVKTNAQEEVNKAVASETGWKKIKYDLKNAKLSSNAKEMIATAVLQNGKWNSLTWQQQKALIRTNSAETIYDVMRANGTWDKLSWQQQAAIVNSNSKGEVGAAMIDNGHWNDLTWKQQQALVQTNAGKTAMEALAAKGQWDGLSLETKKAIVSSNSKKEIAQAIIDAGEWNNLEFDDQEALVTNKASKPIMEALNDAGKWDGLSIEAKQAIVQAKGKEELSDAITKFGLWNDLPIKEQLAAIKTEGVQDIAGALYQVDIWNGLTPEQKTAVAHAKGAEEVFTAIGGIDKWNSASPAQKEAIVHAFGGEAVANTILSMNNWNLMTPQQKNATVQSLGHQELLSMIGGVNTFSGLTPKQQQAVAVAIGKGDVTTLTNTMNMWTGLTPKQQTAIAHAQGSDKVWGAIGTFQNWNALPQNVKTSIAKQTGKGDVQGAINTFHNWNGLPQNQKNAISKQSGKGDVQGTINTFSTWNGLTQKQKTAISKQVGKGNVDGAIKSIQSFASQGDSKKTMTTNVVKNFISNFIEKHKKAAKGTSDFEGGGLMVNDEPGSIFRELVIPPNGQPFIPEGRNFLFSAPRHTQVVPARKTNRLLGGIPQFAKGTLGHNQAVQTLLAAKPMIQAQQQSVTNNRIVQVSNFNGLEEKLQQLDKLTDIVGYLAKILAKNPNLYLDGKQVGESVEPTVSKNQMQNNILTERGVFSG
ncbi:phage tail tape measure protein [Loigolactobacillus coryniformis]|uniref:phage tail tape measure protein n=1 Tax=Loigolactobacillus coryniformis TaxID=1610 RepID=UPI003F29D865